MDQTKALQQAVTEIAARSDQPELTLADLLDRAAEALAREEVQYAMGLDMEHVVVQDYVDATDAQGRVHRVLVDLDPDEQEREKLAEIAEHEAFVEQLRAAAVNLRDQA